MKVILLQDIKSLGKRRYRRNGEGYGRQLSAASQISERSQCG